MRLSLRLCLISLSFFLSPFLGAGRCPIAFPVSGRLCWETHCRRYHSGQLRLLAPVRSLSLVSLFVCLWHFVSPERQAYTACMAG